MIDDFFVGVEHRWPAGRDDLHWHLLLPPDEVEEQLVGPYREILDRPGLAPVEARWLHTTVMHGGPVAEYRAGEIDTIVDRVRQECAGLAPIDLTFDRPSPGRVGVECAARPGAPGRRLWELTTQIDAEVTGRRFPVLPESWYPHSSVAYGIAGPDRPDRQAIKVALSDHPGEPVTLRASTLVLVAQRHDRRHITWDRLADVRLGTGDTSQADEAGKAETVEG
ncbi:2'-5' RNA ligase family protein [Streptomyces sp. NPDC059605]|uniref:2'-5' RNA ligase family protein n=1 Tax=unclassified Streptomyces TaxID=2593676 RepID=UPI00367E3EAB